MGLSICVGEKRFLLGDATFFKSLFSTIFVRGEDRDWGGTYPVIMRSLYSGRVASSAASDALKELEALRNCLAQHAPSEVVWDFEQPESKPPWGDTVSPHISSLGNYFVTSDGTDLLSVLSAAFAEAMATGHDVTVE